MNPFFKKIFLFFLLLFCLDTSAQDDIFTEKREKNNQPTFFIGSGLYTLNGDIKNENSGLLKGSSGVYAGIKFDVLKNIDLSFSLIKNSFSANNQVESFSSEINGVGLHLGYVPNWRLKFLKLQPIFSLGLEQYGVSTIINGESKDGSSMFAVASRLGIRMDFTDRLKFDITTSSGIAFGDIDMSSSEENDGFRSLNFTIHYDLFAGSGKKKDGFSNNNYYEDVDFEKLENEDEDSDLVLDIDDYCPGTPLGVKVDANGCPLDNDKDGIPNYLDKQKDTPLGSIVDENGVSLTADKYYGMYSDYEVASRKYANFYNELEIQREDYKTVDEYLIARANAFNKAYNESLRLNQTVETLVYKVKIGEFKEAIPPKIQNSLLSFNDLESFTMTSDVVLYSVGSYSNLQDAMQRQRRLEDKGFLNTEILVDNNGEVSKYVPFVPANDIVDVEAAITDTIQDSLSINESIAKEELGDVSSIIYRIQIGAFNVPLPDAVFQGVDNLLSFTGKDGFIRYMAGSFSDYQGAIDYQAQMRARGFSDAFIVTFQDGNRIGLDIAIKDNNIKINQTKESNQPSDDFKFTVQIMVSEGLVSADDIVLMAKLGKIDKRATGSDMYEYYAGTYSSLEEANIQLERAKNIGFSDAFVFATNNGERVSLEYVKNFLKKEPSE